MNESKKSDFRTSRGYQMISRKEGRLTPAMEDYLEMIYRSCETAGYSRVGKLSELLHVKPSSASKMIFKLADMGYVKYDRYEIIQLTLEGKKAGSYLLHRHKVIEEFLRLVGSENVLEETELIEHSLSPSTVGRMSDFSEFFRTDAEALKRYLAFLGRGGGEPGR